jgi:hypothetical protein
MNNDQALTDFDVRVMAAEMVTDMTSAALAAGNPFVIRDFFEFAQMVERYLVTGSHHLPSKSGH